MKWTSTIPTKEGFYWVKCRGIMSGNEYIQVAKIYSSQSNDTCDMLYLEGDNYGIRPSQMSVRCNPANVEQFSDEPITMPVE